LDWEFHVLVELLDAVIRQDFASEPETTASVMSSSTRDDLSVLLGATPVEFCQILPPNAKEDMVVNPFR
jgi:hypothetical protein